jgi:hypothetical protein
MAKRPVVPEDVLVYPELLSLARAAGLSGQVLFAPTTANRGVVETLYYFVLGKIRPLQHVLPCTVDLIFTRDA